MIIIPRLTLCAPLALLALGVPASGVDHVVFGTAFGSALANKPGNDYFRATDGDPATFFDAAQADGASTGLMTGSAPQRVLRIRYQPRAGFAGRMVGGRFQGSNQPQAGYVDLHVISAAPAAGWNMVPVANATPFSYLRYVGPAASYGNIAEIEFISDTSSLGAAVDPNTDADGYVNRFILGVAASGERGVAASGSWWGPTSTFFQNQVWTVVKKAEPGKVHAPGSAVPWTFTCLMPGKLPGKGGVPNTLSYPTLLYNFGNGTPATVEPSAGNLEQWHTLVRNAPGEGSLEQRARCLAFEEADNPFNETGVPSRRGDEVRNNFNVMAWFGDRTQEPGYGQTNTANHLALPTQRQDIMDGHAWYDEDVEYCYSVPENATDYAGRTVRGVIQLRSYAMACRHPNCGHGDDTPINVHHHAIKIDVGGEDRWVAQDLTQPDADPLAEEHRQKNLVVFTLDTRELSNGWHILAYHMHVIDDRPIPGLQGKQLASEVKIPIFVDNQVGQPPNQAPAVSAGADIAATHPATAPLAGSVSDDGLPNPPASVSVAWSLVSGPGAVNFADAASATTSAAFAVAGDYVLRLTANDGATSASDDVAVAVRGTGDDGGFRQAADGLVVIEAEHVIANQPAGGHQWLERGGVSGASGVSMRCEPDSGAQIDNGYAGGSPRLDYAIDFTRTGRHYVWVRALAIGTGDNSCHLGLDGQPVVSGARVGNIAPYNQWVWWSANTGGARVAIDVGSIGRHQLNVWMREDGMRLDRILITPDPAYLPGGVGPAESARGGMTPFTEIAINCGGGDVTTPSGVVYGADTFVTGGGAYAVTAAIAGSEDDEILRSERWGDAAYAVPVPPGDYLLTLHFAEIYWTASNRRRFDVLVEGVEVIADLDIFAVVGANAALTREVEVHIGDGTFDLRLRGDVDNASCAAWRLRRIPSAMSLIESESTPSAMVTVVPEPADPDAPEERQMATLGGGDGRRAPGCCAATR